ncbi:MAG TPA: ArsR family transcriptional regulator, partial [Thermoplasmataceae archaeon]|nr:ArsR family transcriptional regulator [Thermoplasmataceae archaeon]
IYATTLKEEQLVDYEGQIKEMMGAEKGVFVGDVAEKLSISQTLLRGIVKRSNILQIKGYKIELVSGI